MGNIPWGNQTAVRNSLQRKPCLILIMGVAGSGKSTLAREILRRIWAVYLDNNHIVDAFFPNRREGASYEPLRPGFYRALYAVAEANLKLGNSVLLDVPHIREVQTVKWRVFIRRLAKRADAKIIAIRCFCSEQVLRRRLQARGEKRDRWKLTQWRDFLTAQPVQAEIPFPHLDVCTEKNLSANVRSAVQYILGRSRFC